MANEALTLLELNKRISSLIMVSSTQNVWVTAELSDVVVRGGHCYMELLQKDPEKGTTLAKARAMIWANLYPRIESQFYAATGQRFATGIKVMVQVSATMHPVYGISLVVSAVNPEYTMGDLLRRRREMLERLKHEGILEMNRSLEWTTLPQRIAVVSAPGAAGYGDFRDQLYKNQARLKFKVELFPAVMQGERAPETIIAALEQIAMQSDAWDCVVIIRGGGATSDLVAFENYDLATHVAQFPLPVIVGIGHDRDVTILDYVAKKSVKTPTAAAEWLIACGVKALERLRRIGAEMLQTVADRLAGCKEQLSYIEGLIPSVAGAVIQSNKAKVQSQLLVLASVGSRRISPELARLNHVKDVMVSATKMAIERKNIRLNTIAELLDAISPHATLRRGYSITRINGQVVTSVSQISHGAVLETTLADGMIKSTTNN
ncbi:MAG: exodeoxyribonuclease VII large subunit [Muribaculaceae bacterium]|nr:exodeoxyribonuclease VII large subunit [Muribaculaceae bacterium]